MAHDKHAGQNTARDAAPDTQSPQPGLRDAGQVSVRTEVVVGRGQDVVEPGTHDSGRNRHDSDIEDYLRPAPSGPVSPVGPPHGHENAGKNAQRVGPDRDGTDVPDT